MKRIRRLSYFLHPSGKLPVRMWCQVWKPWINYQVQGLSVQLKNGRLEVLELVALFLLKTETWDAKNSWEFFLDAVFCLVKRVSKRETQVQSKFNEWKFFNIAPHSAKSCSSCIANCIRRRFLIPQFLAVKLWLRIPLQIGHSPSAVFLYLCVKFNKCVSVAF